jgi:hypothetical protein
VLSELYESSAGVVEHWRLAVESWEDIPAFMAWSKGKAATPHGGGILQALW